MTAVRDTLCNLRPLEIPRPHVPGFQFIPTRGRQGFYKSIRRDGAQYGIHIKPMGPRRPTLADAYWNFKDNNNEKSESKDTKPEHNTSENANCRLEEQQNNASTTTKKQSKTQMLSLNLKLQLTYTNI
uniref:MBD domain-containing protein n=1 Tax=Syphacia muris TaxID=451379 RepID=A0A0N5AAN7_9BILA